MAACQERHRWRRASITLKCILAGGEDAATRYFKRSTPAALSGKFLPIVKRATQKRETCGQVQRAGLFLMIAGEEKKIRQNPAGAASGVISKVFGAIGK